MKMNNFEGLSVFGIVRIRNPGVRVPVSLGETARAGIAERVEGSAGN